MNKKFLSAILFGALAVASTGSFVSCKDYDDDIDNLQTQINGLASAKDLSDKVSALQSAISSAQTAAEAKAAAAQAVADAAKAAAEKAGADAKAANDAAAAAADAAAKALDAAVAVLEKDINDVKGAQAAAEEACKKALDELQAAVDKAATKDELKAAQDAQAAVAEGLENSIKEVKASVEELASTKADKKDLEAAKEAALAAAADAKDAAVKAGKDAAAALAAAEKKLNEAVAAADASAKKAQETADKANAAVAELAKTAATKEELAAAAAAAQKAQEAADAAKEDAAAAAAAAQKAQETADKNAAALATQANAIAAKAEAKAVEKLEGRVDELEKAIKALVGSEDLVKILADLAEGLNDEFDAIIGEAGAMVTSVDLWVSEWTAPNAGGNNSDGINNTTKSGLWFQQYQEVYTGKFPKENPVMADGLYKPEIKNPINDFQIGHTTTKMDSLVIRVSPVTAKLDKSMVSLINSNGEESSYVKVVDVERYDNGGSLLTTRANSGNNGLWTVYFEVEENKIPEYHKENQVYLKYKKNQQAGKPEEIDYAEYEKIMAEGPDSEYFVQTKYILFAVSVVNTEDPDRRIISSYDVMTDITPAPHANMIFVGQSDKTNHNELLEELTPISDVHNRYYYSEVEHIETDWLEELVWPAWTYTHIATADSIKDLAISREDAEYLADNRQDERILTLKPNKDGSYTVKIAFDNPVRGYYVTLDADRALESAGITGKYGSELSSWVDGNKYLSGFNTVVTGEDKNGVTNGEFTFTLGTLNWDIVGFRVYAINMDGCLMDPDGMAFYVMNELEVNESNYAVVLDTYKKVEGGYWAPSNDVVHKEVMTGDTLMLEEKSYFELPENLGHVNGGTLAWNRESYRLLTVTMTGWADDETPCGGEVLFFTKDEDGKLVRATHEGDVVVALQVKADHAPYVSDKKTYTLKITNYVMNGSVASIPSDVITIKVTKKLPGQDKRTITPNTLPGQVPTIWFSTVGDDERAVTYAEDGVDLSDIFENLFATELEAIPATVYVDSIENNKMEGYEIPELEPFVKENIWKGYVNNKQHDFIVNTTYDYSDIVECDDDSTYTSDDVVKIALKSVWSGLTAAATTDTIAYYLQEEGVNKLTNKNDTVTGLDKELDITTIKVKSEFDAYANGIALDDVLDADGGLSIKVVDGAEAIVLSGDLKKYITISYESGIISYTWIDQYDGQNEGTHNTATNVSGTITITLVDAFGNEYPVSITLVMLPQVIDYN